MPSPAAIAPPTRLTLTHWLILVMAAIGFAFDIYELLMLPLIIRPALMELLNVQPGSEAFNWWRGVLFYVPALAGGIFGLFGGYLTDRLGRRRVLTGSILLYAGSAFVAGFSTNVWMLLIFRCTTFIGFCVEFVAAVAWLAELFPNPHQRERALGYTQAFSSLGGLLVAIANGLLLERAAILPVLSIPEPLSFLGEISGSQGMPWRYTLLSGIVPAIPLILIRPFLPESQAWLAKKQAGTLKRPSVAQLFAPALRRTTIVATLMVACNYGAALGAIQLIPNIVPGLHDVKERVQDKKQAEARIFEQKVGSEYVKVQEIGGLIGRFLLAMLAVAIVSRRRLLRIFQVPGLFVVPLVFYFFLKVENQTFFELDLSAIYLGKFPFTTVSLGVFLAGLVTVAQFSFWGNYLPRVFPLHLRGTGEGFVANIGGRAVGTGFNAVTNFLATLAFIPGTTDPEKLSMAAAIVGLFTYLVGFGLSFLMTDPKEQNLPD